MVLGNAEVIAEQVTIAAYIYIYIYIYICIYKYLYMYMYMTEKVRGCLYLPVEGEEDGAEEGHERRGDGRARHDRRAERPHL